MFRTLSLLVLCAVTACAALAEPPGRQPAPQRVFYRLASGAWEPLSCRCDTAGALHFTVDPAQIGASATAVVFDPPPGLVLNDNEAPRVIGLKLDGTPYPTGPWPLDLDWLAKQPRNVRIAFSDRQNALDARSLRITLDGRAFADPSACATLGVEHPDGPGVTWVDLALEPWLDQPGPLTHTITVSIADRSPQQNRVGLSLRYTCLDEATIEQSPTVLTDTAYAGYENLKVLTDGKVMTPGSTTYGVTWASAEEAGNHWVVFAWPEPQVLREATVSWASFAGTFWSPNRLLVQTWENDRWTTRQTLDGLLDKPTTAVDLGGVKTTRLRLLQPDGQGNPARPHIMWVTEIAVR